MGIKCFISGVEYKLVNNYSITEQANSISSSNATVEVGEGMVIPTPLMSFNLTLDDEPFFTGIIQNVKSPTFSTQYEVKKYSLTILSIESLFNNRLVSEAFEDKFLHEIIYYLWDVYIRPEGIDLGFISESEQKYNNYNCSFTKLANVLNELSEQDGGTFYVSPDKKFYFLTREEFIEVVHPKIFELSVDDDLDELTSKQFLSGAIEETSIQSETVIYSSGSSIPLGYQISDMIGITINAAPANIGIRGVDEDDITITFLWEIGSNSITINPNASVIPEELDILTFLYYGYFEILVINSNDILINDIKNKNGSSGLIESILIDETINNLEDANTTANGLLDKNSTTKIELSCKCKDLYKSKLYSVWALDYPNINVGGSFVITERNITPKGPEEYEISVKLKTRNFFQSYGTVFKKEDKNVGKDIKVYKESILNESADASETYTITNSGIVYFPSPTAFSDQLFQETLYLI